MPKRRMSFSFSRMNSYSKCPYYFLKVNLEKVPVVEASFLTTGATIHEILKNYTLECHRQGKTNLFESWEEIAIATIKENHVDLEYEQEILDAVKLYVEANEIELEGLAGVEEQVAITKELTSCGWDEGWFRGIIDKLYIMDTNCKISDYKTGFNMKPDPFQLEIYVWLVSLLYPHLEYFEVELDFTRFNSKRSWVVSKDQIPTIQKRVMSRCAKIEEDTTFEPRVTSLCSDCPIWNICPAIKGIGEKSILPMPTNKKDAGGLLKNIVARTKELDELKNLMKLYVHKYGDVVNEDMTAYYKAVVKKGYDIRGLVAWANENGKDILGILSVDSRKAKKVELPKEFIDEKMSARFSVEKVKKS